MTWNDSHLWTPNLLFILVSSAEVNRSTEHPTRIEQFDHRITTIDHWWHPTISIEIIPTVRHWVSTVDTGVSCCTHPSPHPRRKLTTGSWRHHEAVEWDDYCCQWQVCYSLTFVFLVRGCVSLEHIGSVGQRVVGDSVLTERPSLLIGSRSQYVPGSHRCDGGGGSAGGGGGGGML